MSITKTQSYSFYILRILYYFAIVAIALVILLLVFKYFVATAIQPNPSLDPSESSVSEIYYLDSKELITPNYLLANILSKTLLNNQAKHICPNVKPNSTIELITKNNKVVNCNINTFKPLSQKPLDKKIPFSKYILFMEYKSILETSRLTPREVCISKFLSVGKIFNFVTLSNIEDTGAIWNDNYKYNMVCTIS